MTQTTQSPQDLELKSRMERLEDLLARVEKISDPAARDITSQIIQTLMEFHSAGLQKILEHLAEAGALGERVIDQLGQDEVVSSLLLLYGLHPVSLEDRVQSALRQARPYLASHGGNVELLEISADGAVHLQMQGSCHGCPSSMQTLKNSIEQAIYDKAPDVTAIHVAGIEEAQPQQVNGFVPIEQLIASSGKHSLQGASHGT
jgi:Fe-S cluster biogenesis protein NfuA